MYQFFYALTAVFILAWIVMLIIGSMGGWVHVLLIGAVLSMGIGLFRRSAGS